MNVDGNVMVACCYRFSWAVLGFIQALPLIGDVFHVDIRCQSYLPGWRPNRNYKECYSALASEGGVLLDLIHEIDYAGWIFGWPARLMAHIPKSEKLGISAEESANIMLEIKNGLSVHVRLDYLSQVPVRRMVAFGSQGILEMDLIAQTLVSNCRQMSDQCQRFPQTRDEMLWEQGRSFLGDEWRGTNLVEGIKALRVCDAAKASAADGQWIALESKWT